MLQVYLGEQYVNNSTLSDVTFLVEGIKNFAIESLIYAYKAALMALDCAGLADKGT